MNTVDCERTRSLIDEYVERRLGRRDRLQLETHLRECPDCAREMRAHPAFDRYLRRQISASVECLHVSTRTTAHVMQAARVSVRRRGWTARLRLVGQATAGVAAVVVLVTTLAYTMGRLPAAWSDLALSLPGMRQPARSLTLSRLVIDPTHLHAGELFTTTVYLRNERNQPLPVTQLNLDIHGPKRTYHFVLGSQEPIPANGGAVLYITPAWLGEASEDQYQVMAGDILDVPGTYTVCLTLFSPTGTPGR